MKSPKNQFSVLLSYLLIVLSFSYFWFKGPARAKFDINDFCSPYVSTKLWLQGHNPYDQSVVDAVWRQSGGTDPNSLTTNAESYSVYPPTAFVVLTPFAYLRWPQAILLLEALGILLHILTCFLFATLVDTNWHSTRRLCFFAFALALSPIQSSLHVVNVSLLATGLLCLATYRLVRGTRELDYVVVFSVLLSICIKPTLGIIIMPWILLRRWKTGIAITTLCLSVSAIAIYSLHAGGSAWIESYKANVDHIFGSGGVADISPLNTSRFDRIDMQQAIYEIYPHKDAALFITLGFFAVLCALYLVSLLKRNAAPSSRLLELATLCVLGLIPFYQRYYSAVLILPAAAWAAINLNKDISKWILAGCALFLVNTSAVCRILAFYFKNPIFMRFNSHQSWIIMAMACALLFTYVQERRETPNYS